MAHSCFYLLKWSTKGLDYKNTRAGSLLFNLDHVVLNDVSIIDIQKCAQKYILIYIYIKYNFLYLWKFKTEEDSCTMNSFSWRNPISASPPIAPRTSVTAREGIDWALALSWAAENKKNTHQKKPNQKKTNKKTQEIPPQNKPLRRG